MTDPKGQMFISYRRSPARPSGDDEARMVQDALRDRGIPTWRDLDDLGPEPTEDELVQTLRDIGIAGAIILVSPQVETSLMIKVVEAPAILDRFKKRDGFMLKPVLINLDYRDIDRVLDRPGAFQEVNRFDILKVSSETLQPTDARRIAKSVVKQRLQTIKAVDPDAPFQIGLFSRRTPGVDGYALRFDVTPYFDGRFAADGTYDTIETALYDAASALATTGDRIQIAARGNAALPLGILFGAVYSPFVFDLVWHQSAPGTSPEVWSLKTGTENIDLDIRVTKGDLQSEDFVLAVSVNAEVEHAAADYLATQPIHPRATIHVGLATGPLQRGQTISAKQGLKVAYAAIDTSRNLRTELRLKRVNLHIFLACPLSLAVLVGQNLNTFNECIVYEHIEGGHPAYIEAHRFRPSSFTFKTQMPAQES